MLFTTIICQLVIASVASPYRKYPFVFLLDVGNEELEKTNTEQIRISIPGGSLAVRYPAVADGDLLTHVRVSSIDFGADLKASILDGGPGYKYVVLVFLSNAGVKCDAVITLQTLPNQVSNSDASSMSSWNGVNLVPQISDESGMNNSAEDTSDVSKENTGNDKSDAELTVSSSNINNYAEKGEYDDENDDSIETDEHFKSNENADSNEKGNNQESGSFEDDDIDESDEQDSTSNEVKIGSAEDGKDDNYHAERLQSDEGYQSNSFDEKSINEDKSLDEDARMYRQDYIYDAKGHNPSGEDPVELDQMFNDEEIHNDSDKHKDNNNNFDSEYESAVA